MGKTVAGVVLAGVVLWFWGFLFWGATNVPYASWKVPHDEAAAQQMLRQQFPEGGHYVIPGRGDTEAVLRQRLQAGPVGSVDVSYASHAPLDAKQLVLGLLLDIGFAAVLGLLMFRVRNASRTWSGRLGVPLWSGIAAVLLMHGDEVLWWQRALDWQLWQAGYEVGAFLVTGAVLAAFIKGPARERLV